MSLGDAFIEIEAKKKSKNRILVEEELAEKHPKLSEYEILCAHLKTTELHGDYYGTCKSKARLNASPPEEQDRTCPAFYHCLMASYVDKNKIYECSFRKARK
jgi:hypothetical protein